MLFEIATVLVLTVINGLLSMSELAVVSSRPARLRLKAEQGSRGARIALSLGENPGRFLSTVQIGITLVGVLAGAFSGATLGARLAGYLEAEGLSGDIADAVGVGLVVAAITYLSLVVGELVPKQIALRDPEAVAIRVAPAMAFLSRVAAPLVWLLDMSGKLILRLLGRSGDGDAAVTEEEVRSIIAEAETAGVIEAEEKAMISGVMRLSDRTARGLMTPRRDVEIIDLADDVRTVRRQLRETRRSRLPVRDGADDAIAGVIVAKDALEARDLRPLVQTAPVVSDNAPALEVLKAVRESTVHMALVFDEYGHFEGIVTAGDFLEAITGAFEDEQDGEEAIVERADGTLLVAGWMPIDEFADRLSFPLESDPDYETVAGLVVRLFNRLPSVGDTIEADGFSFEVVDLDGRRVDKLIVRRPLTPPV